MKKCPSLARRTGCTIDPARSSGTVASVGRVGVGDGRADSKRTYLPLRMLAENWVRTFLQCPRFRVLELNIGTVLDATALPDDFHTDQADRLIVATTRHHHLTLITDDRKTLDYGGQGYLRARPPGDKELLS